MRWVGNLGREGLGRPSMRFMVGVGVLLVVVGGGGAAFVCAWCWNADGGGGGGGGGSVDLDLVVDVCDFFLGTGGLKRWVR